MNTSDFGSVYNGICIKDNNPVAIKMEKRNSKFNLLESEAYLLMNLKGFGIPKILSYGHYGLYNVLIEEMLGMTLPNILASKRLSKFKLKDICMIGIQCLDRLEYIHSKLVIHRDIKPSNFVIGREDPEVIYLIDFGLSKKYKSSRTGKHIQFKNIKLSYGSLRYISINGNRGFEQSRRDDLESLGYMLVFLSKGCIPWDKAEKIKDPPKKYITTANIKKSITSEQLCKDLPEEMAKYIDYCKELYFEQDPDYNYLRFLFQTILIKMKQNNDLNFCWISNKLLKNINKKGKVTESRNSKISVSPHIRLLNKIEKSLRDNNSFVNIRNSNNKENPTKFDNSLNIFYNTTKENLNLSGELEIMPKKKKNKSYFESESTKEKELTILNKEKSTSSDEKKFKQENNNEKEKMLNNKIYYTQIIKYNPQSPDIDDEENKNKIMDLNFQDIDIVEMDKINNFDFDMDLVQLNDDNDNNNKKDNLNNKNIVLKKKNILETKINGGNNIKNNVKNNSIKKLLITDSIFWDDNSGNSIEENIPYSHNNLLGKNLINSFKYNNMRDSINNNVNLTNYILEKNKYNNKFKNNIANNNINEKNKKIFIYNNKNSNNNISLQKSLELPENNFIKKNNTYMNYNINKEKINSKLLKINTDSKILINNNNQFCNQNKNKMNFYNKKINYYSPLNPNYKKREFIPIDKMNIFANSLSYIHKMQNLNGNKNMINEYTFDKNKEIKTLKNLKNINQESKIKNNKKLSMNNNIETYNNSILMKNMIY